MSALASALRDHGHDVTVVVPAPSYPVRQVFDGFESVAPVDTVSDGVRVWRVPPVLPRKASVPVRIIAELRNAWRQFACAMKLDADVVIATSPIIPLGPIAWMIARLKRARFAWDIRDLTWMYAGDLGKVRSRAILWLTEQLVLSTARAADLVTTTTPEQGEYFRSHGIETKTVINALDPATMARLLAVPGSEPHAGPLRILYAGLIGFPQGIGNLIDAALLLDPKSVQVEIAGAGLDEAAIRARVDELGLSNVVFHGYADQATLDRLYAGADVLYAQLRAARSLRTALPTKLAEYMAAGRPVIFGGEGAGARLIGSSGAGLVIPPDDPHALSSAITELQSCTRRAEMGARGREYAELHLRREPAIERFVAEITAMA
ncbi:MAG: glycosyltransferase family 4 protein [Gemmatimonadota bacterium]